MLEWSWQTVVVSGGEGMKSCWRKIFGAKSGGVGKGRGRWVKRRKIVCGNDDGGGDEGKRVVRRREDGLLEWRKRKREGKY